MFPKFYDPKAEQVRVINREVVYKQSLEFKKNDSKINCCLFVVNQQIMFSSPISPTYICGADGNANSIAEFIYNNMSDISHIVMVNHFSPIININNRLFWKTKTGKDLIVGETINLENYVKGKIVISDKVYNSVPKCEHDSLNKYVEKILTNLKESEVEFKVNNFFGINGSVESSVSVNVEEAVFFHSSVTGLMPSYETVGMHPFYNYESIFSPSIHGDVDKLLILRRNSAIEKMYNYDKILFSGQSFETLIKSVEDLISFNPDLANKIVILNNCSSCRNILKKEKTNSIIEKLKKSGVKFGSEIF